MKHLGMALMSLVSLAGPCSKTDGGGDASSGGTTSAKASPPNPMIVEHVKAHVAGCETVNIESGQAYGCKSGLREAFEKAIRAQKPSDFATSFATLIASKDDPKTSATAIALLAEEIDVLGEDGKRTNATPEAIDGLLAVFKENTGNRAVRIAKPRGRRATSATRT